MDKKRRVQHTEEHKKRFSLFYNNCWIKSGLLGPAYGPYRAPKGHILYQHQEVSDLDHVRSELASLIGKVAAQRHLETLYYWKISSILR
jgi:hypothetical protein